MNSEYYQAPSDKSFEDMKRVAIERWRSYDPTYGYPDEKIDSFKDIKNIGDNFMYIFAMFDVQNQRLVVERLKATTRHELMKRLIAGGHTLPMLHDLGL